MARKPKPAMPPRNPTARVTRELSRLRKRLIRILVSCDRLALDVAAGHGARAEGSAGVIYDGLHSSALSAEPLVRAVEQWCEERQP